MSNFETTSFILRMSIGLGLAVVVGTLLHSPKTMWISVVVLSLTQLSEVTMKQKLKHRMIAHLIGILLFVVCIHWLLPEHFYGLAALALGLLYSFVNEYKYQHIITTINVLTVSVMVLGVGASIFHRVTLLFCGIAIVFLLYGLQKAMVSLVKRSRENSLQMHPYS